LIPQNYNVDNAVLVAQAINDYKELKRDNGMHFYNPYKKQKEFHAAGLTFSQRCFGAGNQLGKTVAGANEAAFHATGVYPDDWEGARFTQRNVGWVTGESGELIRDTVQKLLCGRMQIEEEIGTGTIPKEKLLKCVKSNGVKDLLDHVKVLHADGGTSLIFFKSREKGRAKLQGETIDWVWHDEEPDQDIYTECLTRTNKGQNGQFSFMTFTPLKGMTAVVNQFYSEPTKFQHLTMMTIMDVDHYTKEEKDQIVASYPEHEREARSKGIPILGEGRIFPISEEHIKVIPFDIPEHWPRIKALDLGTYDHPSACCFVAWDRDQDTVYIYNGWKASKKTIAEEAVLINKLHKWVPVAWPHDALKHDKNTQSTIRDLYAAEGVNMLEERTTFESGGNSVEMGLSMMLNMMVLGKFKVFSQLEMFFEEFRLYHRKDGKVVKTRDDFLDAVRYAIMSLRHAETEPYDGPIEEDNNTGYW